MFNFFKYSDRRHIQFMKEIQIDELAQQNFNKCPNEIFKYYLLVRKINRIQFENVEKQNIFNTYETVENNLKEIDDLQNNILNIVNDNNFCDIISKIII